VLVVAIVFWGCAALILYTQLGYGLLLVLLARLRGGRGAAGAAPVAEADLPSVSLVVAAYKEEAVIAQKVANVRALDYPADKLELIVACDGSPDATPRRAREAGADVVLELPRGGKIRAQDAGVRAARGEIAAFSDANAFWAPDALRRLVAPFATDDRVGYVCGDVSFVNDDDGTNQEGLYWRYEMALRRRESQLASVTGGEPPTSRSTRSWATTCRSRSTWSSAGGRRSTRPPRTRARRWCRRSKASSRASGA
jgi:cellulose synthase/poly-beta-1,6-N-acetylglucosamine synthase-like glycosyltransferase